MKPIRTLATNFDYLPPLNMKDCDPLPVTRTSDGRTISVWEFTDEERKKIAAGENLEVHVWQQPPAPIGMMLTKATEVARPPYSERVGKRSRELFGNSNPAATMPKPDVHPTGQNPAR